MLGFRPHKDQWFSPVAADSSEDDPEQPISILDVWPFAISFQDFKLMTKREVFQGKRTMRPQR
jgi:hypothetical protein